MSKKNSLLVVADSHPNIVVSFQVNDENLMWSILLSYIYLVALLASHVWSFPFKKAPFYFSSISVAIDYLLYYNFLLGILHYAAYVCNTGLWSLLCTGSFIGEALQDIWEMLNEFTSDLSTVSRQTGAVLFVAGLQGTLGNFGGLVLSFCIWCLCDL